MKATRVVEHEPQQFSERPSKTAVIALRARAAHAVAVIQAAILKAAKVAT